MDDLTRIEKKLSGSFGILAGYLTEIKLDDLDKVKDDHPKLVEFPSLRFSHLLKSA